MSVTHVLLLTDAVESTKLTEELGDSAASVLWAEHDRLARMTMRKWEGREVDKSDGFLLVFQRVEQAIGCACDLHESLASLHPPISVRAGIHVAAMISRPNSSDDIAVGAKPMEFDGLGKAVASRVMSLAGAGQTLLSAAAHEVLEPSSPWDVRSVGHWRMKGLLEPTELFAVGAGKALSPPPDSAKSYRVVRDGDGWQPVAQVIHGLPADLDSFVGRAADLAGLASRFDDSRLVCVLGVGGIGKTRVALRYARQWLGSYSGGAWFCDLSSARTLDGVLHAVAYALGVPLSDREPLRQLAAAIDGRGECLLVLDNFEQVVQLAKLTVGSWMETAPRAKFLVTSRQVLGLAGEEAFVLNPLSNSEAVSLFDRRAKAAGSHRAPGPVSLSAVSRLVELLDRVPLAVELAAARTRSMTVQTILDRMGERFKLLKSGQGSGRQATMRAAIDWSWDLLTPSEKSALAQLSVFDGGFSLSAVEAVVDISEVDAIAWVIDVLQALVEKSLVRRAENSRFYMLRTVQEYAVERLTEPPLEAQALELHRRHGQYFASLSDEGSAMFETIELNNLVVACRHACIRGDAQIACETLARSWACFKRVGPFAAGLDLAQGVELLDLSPAQRSRVDYVAGRAEQAMGRPAEARRRFDAAHEAARRSGDERRIALAQSALAEVDMYEGRTNDAERRFLAAFTDACRIDDAQIQCEILSGLGTLYGAMGQMDKAFEFLQRGLDLAEREGLRRWQGGCAGNLGELYSVQGKLEEAQACFESGLEIARELSDRQWEGNALCNLGWLHFSRGAHELAREHYVEALTVAKEIGHLRLECIVLCNTGLVMEKTAEDRSAQSMFSAALTLARRLGDRRSEGQFLNYLAHSQARTGQIELARASFETGRRLLEAVSDRLSLGLLLCNLSWTEAVSGNSAMAAAVLSEAEANLRHSDVSSTSEIGVALASARAVAESIRSA